jgi:hypothetical protein
MLMKEVAWVTSQAYSDDHHEVLDLLASGKMELESLITARIPLRNVVEDGIMALLDKKEDHIKVIWPVGSRSSDRDSRSWSSPAWLDRLCSIRGGMSNSDLHP